MNKLISARRLGFACGVSAGVFYLGCVLLMSFAGKESLVFLLNGLLHGIDVSTILDPEVGLYTSFLGLINTVVLAWLFGGLLAVVYNLATPKSKNRDS